METSPEEKKSRFSAGPVVNSSKSSKGEKKDTDSQLVSIPLSALIFKKRKIFVDASAINSNGFGCFVEKNSKFFNVNRKPLLITGFERRYISENVECIDRLAENYDKVGDYPTLIAELSKSKSERGTYCFIVNSRKKFVTILDAAKKVSYSFSCFILTIKVSCVVESCHLCQSQRRNHVLKRKIIMKRLKKEEIYDYYYSRANKHLFASSSHC